MAVILVPLGFLLIFLAFRLTSRDSDAPSDWRESVLLAAVVFGLLLAAATELLSLFKCITPAAIAAFWGLVVLGAGTACAVRLQKAGVRFRLRRPQSWGLTILLACTAGPIAAATALTALASAPNNWDSMTYHMARVMQWIQNQSLAFYPTHVLRQLYLSPWAEWAILHLQILSGGDCFANLVQWSSMIGSAIGVSLIVRQLGGDTRVQAFASIVAATIPMGILQATSTQNDYVVAFWLVCFVFFTLSASAAEGSAWKWVLGAGGSLALAMLTKATAYVFALPFLAWLVVALVRKQRAKAWKALVVIAAIGIAANLGHYTRNWQLFGSPLGPWQEASSTYHNQVFSVPHTISNIARNIALHLETPIDQINVLTRDGILLLHKWIGVDASDPRTTWAGLKFTRVAGMATNDSSAGNLAHLALLLAAIGAILVSRRLRQQRVLLLYAASLVFVFLLFCFYLKWQPWNSRLHLPLFVLWSPIIAIAAASILNRRMVNALAALLVVLAIPWATYNLFRPLVGSSSVLRTSRIDEYFNNRPTLRKPFYETAAFLDAEGCSQVGLIGVWDLWEYPVWVVLQNATEKEVRIEHVAVQNISGQKIVPAPSDLCGIVSFEDRGDSIFVNGRTYASALERDSIWLYLRR